jgi:DNA modification methylase
MKKLGSAQIIRADARSLPLADDSVDLIVSSPPYWSLRSYQDNGAHYNGQLGSEATAVDFLDALLDVMRECVRVLKPTGSIFYNLGDKYGPNKSLALIPERFRIRCTDELGLIARAVIVWSKPNGLPESVTDRVRRSHEDWAHFTLEPRYFSAVDEIRESYTDVPKNHGTYVGAAKGSVSPIPIPQNPLGKLPGSVWSIPTEPLRVPDHLGIDHFAAFPTEWPKRIIQGWSPAGVCVACGEGRRPVIERGAADYGQHYPNFREAARLIDKHGFDRAELRALGPSGWNRYKANGGRGHKNDKSADVALCERIERLLGGYAECAIGVASGTQVFAGYACACAPWDCHGELPPTTPAVVLDPFGGTGTTALVAKALGRHGITVDMSADYCRLAEWRTNDRNQLAKVLRIEKAEQQDADQLDLFEEPA